MAPEAGERRKSPRRDVLSTRRGNPHLSTKSLQFKFSLPPLSLSLPLLPFCLTLCVYILSFPLSLSLSLSLSLALSLSLLRSLSLSPFFALSDKARWKEYK